MARVHLTKRFDVKDIERWKKKAVKENRDLTNWMETVLNIASQKKDGIKNMNITKEDLLKLANEMGISVHHLMNLLGLL